MALIEFEDLPDTTTPLTAANLNNNFTECNNIIESGSNANGRYIKYSDGTMICFMSKQYTVNITTAWGSLYESAFTQLGDFPATFTEKPTIVASCSGGTTVWLEVMLPTTTSIGGSYFCRPVSSSNVSTTMSFIAIGRWR